jgi:MYXO-CTERM domain-containing protein
MLLAAVLVLVSTSRAEGLPSDFVSHSNQEDHVAHSNQESGVPGSTTAAAGRLPMPAIWIPASAPLDAHDGGWPDFSIDLGAPDPAGHGNSPRGIDAVPAPTGGLVPAPGGLGLLGLAALAARRRRRRPGHAA